MLSDQGSVLHALLSALTCGDAYAFYRVERRLSSKDKRVVRSEWLKVIPREDERAQDFFDEAALALEAIGMHEFIAALRREEKRRRARNCTPPRFNWSNYVVSMTIRGGRETLEPGFYDGFEGATPFRQLTCGVTFDVVHRDGKYVNGEGDTMMMARCYRVRAGRAECGDLAVYYPNAPTVLDAALHWLLEVAGDREGARRLLRRFPGAADRKWAGQHYRAAGAALSEVLDC